MSPKRILIVLTVIAVLTPLLVSVIIGLVVTSPLILIYSLVSLFHKINKAKKVVGPKTFNLAEQGRQSYMKMFGESVAVKFNGQYDPKFKNLS